MMIATVEQPPKLTDAQYMRAIDDRCRLLEAQLEEKFRDLLLMPEIWAKGKLLEKFKRIWEDRELREGDNIPEQEEEPDWTIADKVGDLGFGDNIPEPLKGTCQKCGMTISKSYLPPEQMDCKHRFEDERSGKDRRKDVAVLITYCGEKLYGQKIPDGLVADADRRKLLDRRKTA